MNPKPIFKLFNPKGKVQVLVHQGATTLIISSVALSLVALTACMQVVPAREPVAEVAPPQAEASEQHHMEALPDIDPADRKFFSPGYGAQPVMSKEAEVLSTIDPADRKFFSPGYGAIPGASEEAEVLSTIDPADRKFFTPGYGVDAGRNDLTAYHQSEWGRSPNMGLGVEALSKIDPADRKFFNPGYGAQTISDNGSEAILPPIENEMDEWSTIWFLLK